VGEIIAAEFIRSPLEGEYNFTTIIMGGAALFLGVCLALFMFNNRLSTLVDQRTAALKKTETRREAISVERELALQRLAEERQRYADVLEGANVGTWDWNFNTGKAILNEKCVQILGYTLDELSPVTTQTWENQCHPEDRKNVIELMQKNMSGEFIHYDCIFRMAHKKGHWVWVHERGRVILRSDEGLPLRMSGIRTDVTEKINMKKEKEKLEEKYRQSQKLESVGRLAGGVAHDLNNLLSPVIGYGEMLMEDLEPEDLARDSIKNILHAGYSARDLVRQLLAFSRKQTMSFENMDLNQVVKDFGKLLRRTIREDIEVELMLSPDIEMVKADIGQLEQVIMNLAVNASDAMLNGGRLSIETSMAHLDESYAASRPGVTPGEYVLLAVSDTGCGMDAKIIENIFEPFFSTKGEKGTGLGLATVYGIVKQHGGNIWVYSEPGRGTSFKIYLPVTNEVNNLKKSTKNNTLNLKGSETILLVEDGQQPLP